MLQIYNFGLYNNTTKERIIKITKAFFLSLVLHLLILGLLYLLLHKVEHSSAAASAEKSMVIDIQSFTSSSLAKEEIPKQAIEISKEENTIDTPPSKESLEEETRKLFEKIANAQTKIEEKLVPIEKVIETTTPLKEKDLEALTKNLFEKIANTQKTIKTLPKEARIETEHGILKKQVKSLPKKIKVQKKVKLAKYEQKPQKKLRQVKKKSIHSSKLKKTKKQKVQKNKKSIKKHKKRTHTKKRKALERGYKRKQHISKDVLANALSKHSKQRPSKSNVSRSTRRMISKFYGSEFNGFSGTQKKFIEENLGNIYVITQGVLSRRGYPDVAIKTHQSGIQLVTFYLHPNGRISGLRLKKRIGYASLDKNTLQVVRIAHGKYPRPKTKTKITFYVEYNLN